MVQRFLAVRQQQSVKLVTDYLAAHSGFRAVTKGAHVFSYSLTLQTSVGRIEFTGLYFARMALNDDVNGETKSQSQCGTGKMPTLLNR